MTEEWFVLLRLAILSTITFLRYDRGVVHLIEVIYVYHYCLRFDRGVVHVIEVAILIYHYCLRYDRGVVHVLLRLAILTTIIV